MVCLLANCLGLTAILGFATNDKSLGLLALDAEAEIAIEFLPEAGTRYACQRDTARRDLRLERRHRPTSQGSAFSLVALAWNDMAKAPRRIFMRAARRAAGVT